MLGTLIFRIEAQNWLMSGVSRIRILLSIHMHNDSLISLLSLSLSLWLSGQNAVSSAQCPVPERPAGHRCPKGPEPKMRRCGHVRRRWRPSAVALPCPSGWRDDPSDDDDDLEGKRENGTVRRKVAMDKLAGLCRLVRLVQVAPWLTPCRDFTLDLLLSFKV